MFKDGIMNKVIFSFFILTLIVVMVIVGFLSYKINEVRKYKYHYEYTDLEGNRGVSSCCYNQEHRKICRDIKEITVVKEYNKVREER